MHASDNARKLAWEDKRRAKRGAAKLAENPPESSNEKPLTVRASVIETPAPAVDIPSPAAAEGAAVPEAGSESGAGKPAVATGAPTDEPAVALDPAVMISLTKGVFALVALRGGEHWNVTEDEIAPIAEPMCRQLARIPFVAALGQNTADLILIGSVFGGLIFARTQQSIELRRMNDEQRRLAPVRARREGVDGQGNIVRIDAERGETRVNDDASGGSRVQEVRDRKSVV